MFGINKKERLKNAMKSSGKKLVKGEYKVGSKLNRLGSAARTVRNDFINDFNSDGPSMRVSSDQGSPFRMGNTADVLPALQRNQQPQRKQKKAKRRPRKVVYY